MAQINTIEQYEFFVDMALEHTGALSYWQSAANEYELWNENESW